jgi:hypothetical protein
MRDAFLLTLLVITGSAQNVFGTWRLNPARSVFSGQPQPRSLVLRLEPHNRGEVVTVDRVERNGQAATTSTLLYLDMAARAYEGGGCSGTQSSRYMDLQTVEILRQCAGGDSERIVRRLDPSGQQLVVEITTQHSGRRSEQRFVLEKQ